MAMNNNAAEYLLGKAQELMSIKNDELALETLTSAITYNPAHAASYCLRSILYHRNNKLDLALRDINRAIELNRKHGFYYRRRGDTYKLKGEYERATNDYMNAIDLSPKDDVAYYYLGSLHTRYGKSYKAIEALTKAIEMNPNRAITYYERGKAYLEAGRNDYLQLNNDNYLNAISDIETYFRSNPKSEILKHHAYKYIGDAYARVKEYDKAINYYDMAIDINPDSTSNYLKRAETYLKADQVPNAEVSLNKILDHDPDDAEAHSLMSSIHISLGNYEYALESLNTAITLNPYHVTNDNYSLLKRKTLLSFYQWAIKKCPGNIILHYMRARAYGGFKEEYMSSISYMKTMRPKTADEYYCRGFIFLYHRHKTDKKAAVRSLDKALNDFNRAIILKPTLINSHWLRACTYVCLKLYEKALEDLNIYLCSYPNSGRALLYRGITHGILGNYESAVNDFCESLQSMHQFNPRDEFRFSIFYNRAVAYKKMGYDYVEEYDIYVKSGKRLNSLDFSPEEVLLSSIFGTVTPTPDEFAYPWP
jgi:tetratricopeptide (TPR) repeat protein